jgi:hypothetical protein
MAKQIKRTDIAEADLYKDIRESATKTIVEINKVNQELQKTAQVIASSLKGELEKTTKSIENFSKNVTTMNGVVEQSLKMDEAKAKALKVQADAEIKLQKLAQEKEKTAQQELKTKQQQEKQANANARAVKNEEDAYKRLVIATRDQKNESKKLGAELLNLEKEGKKNTQAYRELEKQYRQVTAAAQQGDAQLKKLDKTVGDNFRNVGNYSSALGGLKNGLAQLGLVVGVGQVFRNVFGVVKDFDQGVANLASVLGKTREQVVALEEDAKRLGASTSFTASQVAQLQTEYAKLGFTEQEILAATEATLSLAAATGSDLGRAAEVAGSTVRAFGLTADETMRVTDVMAKSFSTSALDMEKFAESMKYVAPVSKAAGLSVEETTAMLGALANAGISGSQAGTALRQVISEMDKTGKSTGEALKDLAEKGLSLSDAESEVGKNAKTALLVLADQTDTIAGLTKEYENAEGSAKEMADTQLNTLGGALALLESAWEGFVLKMNDATGAGSGLTSVIKFLANNLETIFKVLGSVLGIFATYKITVMATNAITKAYAATMGLLNLAFGKNAIATKGADTAMKAFNATTKANPIGLLVTLLATAVTAFFAFRDSATEAEKAQQKLNDAIKAGDEQGKKAATMFRAVSDERFKAIEDEATKRRLAGEDEARVNKWVLEQKKALQEQENKFIDYNIAQREKQAQATVESNKAQISALDERIKKEEQLLIGLSAGDKQIVQSRINGLKSQQRALETSSQMSIKNFESYKAGLLKSRAELDSQILSSAEEVSNAEKEQHEQRKANQIKRQQELDLLRKRAEDLEDNRIQDEFTRREQQLWRAFEREMAAIKGNSEIENRLRKELAMKLDADLLQLEKERHAKSLKLVDDYIAEIDKRNDDRIAKENEQNEKEYQEELKWAEKRTKWKESENLDNIADQRQFDIEEQKRLIEHLKSLLAIHKAYGKEKSEAYLDTEIALKKAEKQLQTMQNETTNSVKDNSEAQKKIIDEVTNYAIKKTDERIAAIDREIAAAQRQADYFEKLAAEGNITAEQSLLEQQKIIDEAEKEREQLERRKQQIQLISAGVSTYQSKVAAGDQSPLLNTIKDITLLTQFLSNLPAFFEGTEDTGAGGGIDGKGGFHAVLHPHERVVSASENAKLKGLTNSELAEVGMKYKNGQLVDFRTRLGMQDKTQTNELLLKEIKDLKEVIASQPQTDWNIGEVTQESFNLIKRTVNKNTVIYNKFRLKK